MAARRIRLAWCNAGLRTLDAAQTGLYDPLGRPLYPQWVLMNLAHLPMHVYPLAAARSLWLRYPHQVTLTAISPASLPHNCLLRAKRN